VKLAKSADTDRFTEIDVTGNGRSTDVEPVGVVGSEFFEGGGFDDIYPGRDLEFAYTRLVRFQTEYGGKGAYRIVSRIESKLC
jgi:hypothetical protein